MSSAKEGARDCGGKGLGDLNEDCKRCLQYLRRSLPSMRT